ncbi:hypothetical protein Ancab_001569, partial [Ancistrocladus abbreviatus]
PKEHRREQRGNPGPLAGPTLWVFFGRKIKEENDRYRVEEEEGVEVCDFFVNYVALCFFESHSTQDEVLLFEPLFEE